MPATGDKPGSGDIPGTGVTPKTPAGGAPVFGWVVAGAPAGVGASVFGVVGASAGSVVVAPGAAGLTGIVPGAPAAGGGVVWPNEVSAKLMEQRETVSSFFIG